MGIGSLLRTLSDLVPGVKISTRASFEQLLGEAAKLRGSEALLQEERMRLLDEGVRLKGEFARLRNEIERLTFERENFGRKFAQVLPRLLAQADGWKIGLRAGGRSRVLIVLTAVSQIPHLKAMSENTYFMENFEPIVFGSFEVEECGLKSLCIERSLPLIDFKYGLSVSGKLRPLEDIFDGVGMVFAHRNDPKPQVPELDLPLPTRTFVEIGEEVARQSTIGRMTAFVLTYCEIDLMVLFEDNAEYDTGIWINSANSLRIPSLLIPFTIADQVEPAESHYHDPLFWSESGVLNKFVAGVYPKWTFAYRDRLMLRRRAADIIACESLGFAQPDPWILNSSHATALAVESDAMYGFYGRNGIRKAQLQLTGSFPDDVAFDATAKLAVLKKELGLDPDRPVLLCSFPPNQLTAVREECEFKSLHELIDFWMAQLQRLEGWEIIVRPHPSSAPRDVDYLRRFPLKVSEMDTARLIPVCNIYNASVSSTIRWALACGKPVFNFDVFRYRYREFADEPAVWTTFSAQEFTGCIDKLCQDDRVLSELTDVAQKAAPRWGFADGQSGQRIGELMRSMCDLRPARPQSGAGRAARFGADGGTLSAADELIRLDQQRWIRTPR
jgi:hypothetical protein